MNSESIALLPRNNNNNNNLPDLDGQRSASFTQRVGNFVANIKTCGEFGRQNQDAFIKAIAARELDKIQTLYFQGATLDLGDKDVKAVLEGPGYPDLKRFLVDIAKGRDWVGIFKTLLLHKDYALAEHMVEAVPFNMRACWNKVELDESVAKNIFSQWGHEPLKKFLIHKLKNPNWLEIFKVLAPINANLGTYMLQNASIELKDRVAIYAWALEQKGQPYAAVAAIQGNLDGRTIEMAEAILITRNLGPFIRKIAENEKSFELPTLARNGDYDVCCSRQGKLSIRVGGDGIDSDVMFSSSLLYYAILYENKELVSNILFNIDSDDRPSLKKMLAVMTNQDMPAESKSEMERVIRQSLGRW